MNRGIFYALFSYIFWGLHPIYWKLLQHVPSIEIVSHRILWSFIFFTVIISFRKGWKELKQKIKASDNKLIIFIPALLIGSNWALYIWAVNAGFIIETSLGYFISPLISVFLGVIFLKESLRKFQWTAVAIACAGVLVMTFIYGQFPWISLYLAGTWGTYGLLRKKSPLGPVDGLLLETATLTIPVLIYLTFLTLTGDASFAIDTPTTLLLIGAGITSGLPLLVFIAGARLINLSLIGILQYIYPTLIFIIGAFVYGEELSEVKMIGFAFIWTALIIYTIDGTFFLRRKSMAVAD
ncbi:MAG: EamA family transporter RarD [Ignavibacteria bacterium]